MRRTRLIVTLGVLALLAGSVMAAPEMPKLAPLPSNVAPAPGPLPEASPGLAAGPVYVVDQNDPKASDDNPGTTAAPWKTIGKAAATAKAGDTVCVMEGDYKEKIKLANSGAKGQPIVFKGVPRRTAKMQGFDTTGCNYLRIEGFFIADTGIGVSVNSDQVSIVDNRFEDVSGVPIDSAQLSTTEKPQESPVGAYIAFNTTYKCGKGVVSGGSNWLFERNEVSRLFWSQKGNDADYTRPFGVGHVLRQNYLHGSKKSENGQSHTDGFQVFDDNHYVSRSILIEENVVNDFAQGLMMEVHTPGDNTINNWTFRRNIIFQLGQNTTDHVWGNAGFNGGCPGFYVENNTLVGGGYGYAGVGHARFENNLMYSCFYWFPKGTVDSFGQKNVIFVPGMPEPAKAYSNIPLALEKDLVNAEPLFQDREKGNYRLKKGSPAIGAGLGGATIGALEYPNVYYVDAWHGGASDENFGYPGAPYKTVAKALAVAEDGETVLLRGGVYRELVKPTKPGLTIKAMKGEKVVISGADEISGWKRNGDKWTAPLAAKPTKVLKDGKPFAEFTYDDAAKTITVTGFDPRLALLETVVRQNAIILSGAPGAKVDGVETTNTLGEGLVK
jgi:hypothetical protein